MNAVLSDGIPLAGTSWRVTRIDGRDAIDGFTATMEFDDHGNVHGNATINRYAATYSHEGDGISFGPALGTRMAGPESAMRQEHRFFESLAAAASIRWAEPSLHIESADGTVIELERTDDGEPFAATPSLVLRGSALYRERIALPPDAVLRVALVDTALADAPSVELAGVAVEAPGQVPIEFELLVPTSSMRGPQRLALQARIEIDGQLEWITDTHHAITRASFDEPQHLLLVRVPNPA